MAGASAAFEFEGFLKAFADVGLAQLALEEERVEAQGIVDRAKELVHVGGENDPKAGETRDSLAIQGEGPNWIDIGSRLEKAFYEEFGSVHGTAVAFLRRAIFEALGGTGKGVGVSWSHMHRPPHSRNRPSQTK